MSVTEAPEPTPPPAPAGADRPPAAIAGEPSDAGRLATLEARVGELDRRVEENRLVHDSWTLVVFAVAAVALLASIIAVGLGMRAVDEAERHAEAGPAPVGVLLAAPAGGRPALAGRPQGRSRSPSRRCGAARRLRRASAGWPGGARRRGWRWSSAPAGRGRWPPRRRRPGW